MKSKPKYLVRPRDFHIFDLDESNGCYRSWSTKKVTYQDGTRPNAMLHFTFDNLTINYDFFPINENDLDLYIEKNKTHNKWLSWSCRNDGHGNAKGGTFEEYIERFGGDFYRILLKRSDLRKEDKLTPLNKINCFNFKATSLTRKNICKADNITFIDDDGKTKVLKCKYSIEN